MHNGEPLEPDGGNLYRPHAFMITSGQFWRCKHGSTGFGDGMKWCGCEQCGREEPERRDKWEAAIREFWRQK